MEIRDQIWIKTLISQEKKEGKIYKFVKPFLLSSWRNETEREKWVGQIWKKRCGEIVDRRDARREIRREGTEAATSGLKKSNANPKLNGNY